MIQIRYLIVNWIKETSHQSLQENNVTHTQTNESEVQDGDHHLKSSSKYTEDRRSSVVDNVKEEINDIHKSNKKREELKHVPLFLLLLITLIPS